MINRVPAQVWLGLLGWLVSTWPADLARAGEPEPRPPVDFRREVLPILADKCFQCHGPDPGTRQANLRLDLEADLLRPVDPVVVPGRAGESELIRRLLSDDLDERMPPPDREPDASAGADRHAPAVGRWWRHLAESLGVPAAPPPRPAPNQPHSLGSEPDRPLRPGQPRPRRARPSARREPRDVAPARHLRPDRAAAVAHRARRVSGRHHTRGCRSGDRPPARLDPPCRADGDRLARPGPLCRHPRLPG